MDNLDHHHNGHHNCHDEDHDPSRHHHRHDEDNLDHHPSRHPVCRARDDANGHDDGDRVTHEDERESGPFLPILSERHPSQGTR